MTRPSFVCLLIVNMVAAIAAELPAQDPMPETKTRRQFNQVFVKVIVPVTSRTLKQDGPVVESWVAEQLKKLGETEYFAVTDWVPVCDGLLEDDVVDNRVWDGNLNGNGHFCPVGGDIPHREMGRVLVSVAGFTPGGGEANITLPDEPGIRAVAPVRLGVGKEGKRIKIEEGLPYVAVIIAPPPQQGVTSRGDAEQAEQSGEPEPPITRILKSQFFRGGPVTAGVLSSRSYREMSMDLADYHRIALLVNCETIDEVISWADSEIERVESPPVSLIEVSLGRSKPIAELTNLLSILVVDPNDDSALFAVLHKIAGMVRDGLWSPDDAIDRIYRYAKTQARNQELRYAFISLAEDLSCIRDGVYWTDDVTALREPLLLAIDRFCSANTNEDDRTMP